MKNVIFGLMLIMVAGCGSAANTIMPAKAGVLLCPQMGAVPFKGNVVLTGDYAVVEPLDKSRFKKLAVPHCIVMVTDEGNTPQETQE